MSEKANWFIYQAKPHGTDRHPHGVVDGDTYDLVLDLGMQTYVTKRCRLAGIDTAEIWGVSKDSEEYAAGIEQKEAVVNFFDEHDLDWPLVVKTHRDEYGVYGRLRVDVIRKDQHGKWQSDGAQDLADWLDDRFGVADGG